MDSNDQRTVLLDLPRPNEKVIVVTPKFRCLGCMGQDGVWRDWFRYKAIENVVGWFSFETPAGPEFWAPINLEASPRAVECPPTTTVFEPAPRKRLAGLLSLLVRRWRD